MKYRRGDGEIVIVIHAGRGWFDPLSLAKGDVFTLAEHLGAEGFADALHIGVTGLPTLEWGSPLVRARAFHDQPARGPLASCGRLGCALRGDRGLSQTHRSPVERDGPAPEDRSRRCRTISISHRTMPGTSRAL